MQLGKGGIIVLDSIITALLGSFYSSAPASASAPASPSDPGFCESNISSILYI